MPLCAMYVCWLGLLAITEPIISPDLVSCVHKAQQLTVEPTYHCRQHYTPNIPSPNTQSSSCLLNITQRQIFIRILLK